MITKVRDIMTEGKAWAVDVAGAMFVLAVAMPCLAIITVDMIFDAMKQKKKEKKMRKAGLCGQCRHITEEFEPDVKGRNFMGRCPFQQYAVFLRHDTCEKFSPR